MSDRATFLTGALAGIAVAIVLSFLIRNLIGGAPPVKRNVPASHPVASAELRRAFGVLFGTPFVDGNRVTVLENGVEIFPAMLAAIDAARDSINFETYIYWSGDIAERFADSLSERARAGVEVNVLLDWLGSSKMEPELIERMEDAGVVVEHFRPLRWWNRDRLNNRTHRKLLIVDGRVGFTGGVGIADEWSGDAQDSDHWHDLHFQVEGPVVAHMQAGFFDNWTRTRYEIEMGEGYFPRLEPRGDVFAQNFISSGDVESRSVQLLFMLAIAGARHTLQIGTPYFVPDEISRKTLLEAANRGVTVRIIVPGPEIDHEVARHASRAEWGPLLEAGIEIHEYQPTMYHCKLLMVDGTFASVGSTNFDIRSFQLNAEANLNVFDPTLVAELEAVFARDLKRSRRITLEEWRARPWHLRLRERLSSLLKSQL